MFIGRVGGCIGETSSVALLLGGAYLIWNGIISWRIPVVYIVTVAVLTALFGRSDGPVAEMLSALFGGSDGSVAEMLPVLLGPVV